MKKMIIGVMGPGTGAKTQDLENAYELGRLIAQQGWVLLTGGRNVGVMDAASRGAKAANGLTIGILPTSDKSGMSEAIDIPIITDLGNGRNNINVLSSDVVIACGMGVGTAAEIALALKSDKQVILLTDNREAQAFFTKLSPQHVMLSNSPEDAIGLIYQILGE